MRRRTAITGGIIAVIFVQLGILAAFALILFRTELTRLPEAQSSTRLSPFLEFGRGVDRWMSGFQKGPVPESALPQANLLIDPDQMERLLESLPSPGDVFDEKLVPWVPAVFAAEGEEYAVHARVYGEGPAHWSRPKKSWEIQFSEDQLFHDMRTMMLLLPEERGWTDEVLRMRRSRALGVLHPAAEFVSVTINGRGPMVYLSKEGWTEEMAQRQGRGPSLALYQISGGIVSPAMQDAAYWVRTGKVAVHVPDDALAALIELSRPGADSDPDYLVKLGAVMDLDRLAAFMALRFLMGNPQAGNDDLRLLYRPDRGLFEPVAWNVPLSEPRPMLAPSGISLLDAAIRVPALRSRAQIMLAEALQSEAGNDLQAIQMLHTDIMAPLFADWWKLQSNRIVRRALEEREKKLRSNIGNLQSQIASSEVLINQRIPREESDVLLTLDCNARGPVAAFLQSIAFPPRFAAALEQNAVQLFRDTGNGSFGEEDLTVATIASGSTLFTSDVQERLLWPGNPAVTAEGEFLRPPHRRHRFFIVGGPRLTIDALPLLIGVGNAVTGSSGQILGTALIDERAYADAAPVTMTRATFLTRHKMFQTEGGSGVLLKGPVLLTGDVVIPLGIPLTIAPGTTVRMGSGALLLSYGPITAIGGIAAPIQFLPEIPDMHWRGVAVVDSSEASDFRFVTFEGGMGSTIGDRPISGTLSLVDSPASITNVTVRGAAGDAAIALARIFVDIRDSTVEGSAHVGILLQSALAGRLEGVKVRTSGSDAISLQSAPVVLRNVTVDQAGGACLHADERSTPLIEQSRFQRCAIGILAENGGHVVADALTLVSNGTGLLARGGIPAYGPGSIVANGTVFIDNKEDVQMGSGGVVASD